MVHMLSLTENLHTILRVLYDDMMVLCYPMSQVAMAIAGIGALLYIAYRVWQSLAQAEPIDLFPLMRPFAIGICILFFPTLVLGSLNGILSPLVKATHSLMVGQTLDMEQWQERRERLELEGREQMPPDSYYAEDEEMERELSELGVDDQTQQTLDRMNEERSSWSVKGLIFKGLAWILELLFAAASVILDVLRTFYLVVLSLLGPIAFAISVFDGFQSTLTQWLTKYVSIYLWLPISDLFSAIIARLQILSLQQVTTGGTSICYTRDNIEAVTNDEFMRFLCEKGAHFGFYFHYMPVGNEAAPELMPTPEQRKYMIDRIRYLRSEECDIPFYPMDFQNDGEFVGGCIAGGRNYFHINSAGDAEPCVFIHYSNANIHDQSILEILHSPLFMAYHNGQPFNKNHLRPCPMLENPELLQKMVHETGAHSTDLQSPESVEHLCEKCKNYAANWQPTADEIWSHTKIRESRYENYKDWKPSQPIEK